MPYDPGSDKWKFKDKRSLPKNNNWIVGMLFFTQAKAFGLQDLHIMVTRPNSDGWYSDVHVTFVFEEKTPQKKRVAHHIYYQITGGKLSATYELAPHDWRDHFWKMYPALQATTEEQAVKFARYCSTLVDRAYQPGQVDPKDKGEPSPERYT